MNAAEKIHVSSHVGRDVLQAAALFKNEQSVVWEYVVNSLQYVDPGVAPRVLIEIDNTRKLVRIRDNGRGMSSQDLKRFFQMHAENADRREGRGGRGKFGTGKSAAFGIANVLKVDTVRDGKRNVVILSRPVIEASSGEEIPTDWSVRDQAVDDENGTTISIEDVFLGKIKKTPIIEYIERHLQHFRQMRPEVAVDDHVCVTRMPSIAREYTFAPDEPLQKYLGPAELKLYVAQAPLQAGDQGVSITCGTGNLVAVETCGVGSKEMGGYIFGEIDVPTLESFETPIEPFDSSRRLELNHAHPVAARLIGFLGAKLEQVRGELVREARDASRKEQARRLAEQGDKIAQILNDDFRAVSERLNTIRSASSRRGASAGKGPQEELGTGDADGWVRGTQESGSIERRSKKESEERGEREEQGVAPPRVQAKAERDEAGKDFVDPVGSDAGKRQRPKGGFRVEYRNLGAETDRSLYDPTGLMILINLDHRVVAAALKGGSAEDPTFRRLSYEIAFSEYAMGLGYEISQQDPDIPADDLLYEVRSTLNRVFSSALGLYRD